LAHVTPIDRLETHFLWHISTGVLLYWPLRGLIVNVETREMACVEASDGHRATTGTDLKKGV